MCLLLPILTFATKCFISPAFLQVCQMFLLPSFPACKLAQGKGCSVICLFFYTIYFFTRRKVAISYSSSYIHNSIMWLTLLILAHAMHVYVFPHKYSCIWNTSNLLMRPTQWYEDHRPKSNINACLPTMGSMISRTGWVGWGVRWRGSREAIANQMGGPCLDKDRDNLEAAFLRADPCWDKGSHIV